MQLRTFRQSFFYDSAGPAGADGFAPLPVILLTNSDNAAAMNNGGITRHKSRRVSSSRLLRAFRTFRIAIPRVTRATRYLALSAVPDPIGRSNQRLSLCSCVLLNPHRADLDALNRGPFPRIPRATAFSALTRSCDLKRRSSVNKRGGAIIGRFLSLMRVIP